MRFKVSVIALALLAVASLGSAQQGQGGGGGGRQGGGFGQRGGMGGAQRLTQLLRNEQVQAELKLSDDQKAKIEALPRPQRGGGGGGNGGGGGGQRPTPPTPEEQLKQLTEDKAATSAILSPEQEKRLEEIRIQWAGGNAATLPDVQEALALTAEQKTKITELQSKMREATMGLMEKMRNGEIDRQDLMPTMQKNNDTFKAEVMKILTADQSAKLKAMSGAELKQEMRRPGGGGGRRNG